MAGKTPIPFSEIAGAALNSIDTLLNHWLPGGKVQSGEYKVTNPLRADNKVGSFSINMRTGKWGDFATTDGAGNDLISLYAYLHGLDQHEAAFEVADQIAFRLPEGCRPDDSQQRERKAPVVDSASVKPKKQKKVRNIRSIMPVPAGAPEAFQAHPHRRFPDSKWAYHDANGQLLGYVYRFNTSDGGKETIPLTFWKDDDKGSAGWEWLQWPEPNRPLYGLDKLAANPEAYVLLVEGEKCADAPGDLIQGITVSWPGGSKAIDKVDWSALAGRKIYAWADCDAKREKLSNTEKEAGIDPLSKPLLPEDKQPGMLAMLKIRDKLMALDPATEFHLVDIPEPGAKPDGWDVYDAIHDDGMNGPALTSFITKTRPELTLVADNSKQQSTAQTADAEEDETPKWVKFMLRKNGDLIPCLANIVDILENDSRWKGVLAFDEFAQRVVKLKPPPFWNNRGKAGEWDAQDDARLAMWITKIWRFNVSSSIVAESVEVAARNNVVNPPREWLEGLKWDGKKRLLTWMHKYMGVVDNEYTQRVGCWFFMGMVKRIIDPGCKFDYCLVLEGPQGRKKSSALEIIGGPWFGDTDLDLHNKDAMSALRGKMLYEISEMGALAKAEASKQKSFLSRKYDEYRPVYGRREIRVPRQVIFAGTVNEWEWNKDPTGGRRFWPVEVSIHIDGEGLQEVREQLFAEAYARVMAGQRYWPTPEEQETLFDKEQLQRTIHESYIDGLEEWVMQRGLELHPEFTLFDAATKGLNIDAKGIGRDIQTRIGNALRQLGCKRVEKRNSEHRFWYKPPERKQAMSSAGAEAKQPGEFDDDIPW